MWNKCQSTVEYEAKEFSFLDNGDSVSIELELWAQMVLVIQTKMHADGFGLREFKSIFVDPRLDLIETSL